MLAEADRVQTVWDEDARRVAYDRAMRMMDRDPDAALYLLAQIQDDHIPAAANSAPYDAMAALATVARYYHFSDPDMQHMPIQRFWGYLRQAILMSERERDDLNNEYDRIKRASPAYR